MSKHLGSIYSPSDDKIIIDTDVTKMLGSLDISGNTIINNNLTVYNHHIHDDLKYDNNVGEIIAADVSMRHFKKDHEEEAYNCTIDHSGVYIIMTAIFFGTGSPFNYAIQDTSFHSNSDCTIRIDNSDIAHFYGRKSGRIQPEITTVAYLNAGQKVSVTAKWYLDPSFDTSLYGTPTADWRADLWYDTVGKYTFLKLLRIA